MFGNDISIIEAPPHRLASYKSEAQRVYVAAERELISGKGSRLEELLNLYTSYGVAVISRISYTAHPESLNYELDEKPFDMNDVIFIMRMARACNVDVQSILALWRCFRRQAKLPT